MTVVAVILAGGRGTRSADPSRAKLGQEIGGLTLLQWHLRLLQSSRIGECLVVAGHLGDQVQELCDAVDSGSVKVQVIHEERQEGTVAALRLAAQHTDADELLIILGDILMSLPVDQFLSEWQISGAGVAVVVHPSSHPHDSDAAFPSHDGSVAVIPKSEPREHIPNMSSAGLFAITRTALERYGSYRDVGSDVLPIAAEKHDLFAFVSSHYLKDTGTPDRLEATKQDVASGAFERRGQLAARPALFLDRDGVINPSQPEYYGPEDYTLLPGVGEAIGDANRAGIPVVVVTNQPGIAKGFMTLDDHQRIRARMDNLLGATGAFVDDYLFCPHHPDAGFEGEVPDLKRVCSCRKPATGMALMAQNHHGLDLARSVMVGDTDRDREWADQTGMRFIHVSDACDRQDPADCYPDSAEAIRRGIEIVTC